MEVAILVFKNCTALGPIGPMEILNKTNPIFNKIQQSKTSASFFNVKLVGVREKTLISTNGFPIQFSETIDSLKNANS